MGAKLHGFRGPLNDNKPKYTGPMDEVPIDAEDFRHPPVIERESGLNWYCLVTVPQAEYRCATSLSDHGVITYVPTDTHWSKRRKGRDWLKVQQQSPIFRGYVFAKLTPPWVVDLGGGPELACGEDWRPINERDQMRRSPHGILGVIGYHGKPLEIPLRRVEIRDGEMVRVGIADFADDERHGWFDDRKRPQLIAGRDAKPKPAVMKGEMVRITAGPFASFEAMAENDNDERGSVRLRVSIFGQATPTMIALDDLENLTRPQKHAGNSLRRA